MTAQEKPLISCNFYGQLGNQFFTIAAVLGYAWDYQALPIFPGLNTPKNRTSYNRDKVFFRLDASNPPRPFSHIYRTDLDTQWCYHQKIPFMPDLILDGYFQSWVHFHHHQDRIKKIFAPSVSIENRLKEKYGQLLNHEKIVGIHVRTQSRKTHNEGHHPFWGIAYYEKAIETFSSDSIFLVFSDRINWCKHHFSKLGNRFIFIEDNDGVEDFFLLTQCKNQILTNSSFSWWAAYLKPSEEGRAIFPNNWRDPHLVPNPPAEYFYLPEWELLECPPKEIYPIDILSYDVCSQSVDNNGPGQD